MCGQSAGRIASPAHGICAIRGISRESPHLISQLVQPNQLLCTYQWLPRQPTLHRTHRDYNSTNHPPFTPSTTHQPT